MKIGKYEIIIDISILNHNDVYGEMAQLLLDEKKLASIVLMKKNFDISLKPAKDIVDNIHSYDPTNDKYVHHIKTKSKIIKFLKKELKNYPKF